MRVFNGIGCLGDAVLGIELRNPFVRLPILLHQAGQDAVEQIEDARGIAVDERRGHADDLAGRLIDLTHGLALSAVIVVLVQLIHDRAVNASAHFLFDIGA